MRTHITKKKFYFMRGRPHKSSPYVIETYGYFRHWNAIP